MQAPLGDWSQPEVSAQGWENCAEREGGEQTRKQSLEVLVMWAPMWGGDHSVS